MSLDKRKDKKKNAGLFHLPQSNKCGQLTLSFDGQDKRKLVEDLIKHFDQPGATKPEFYDFSKLDLSGVDLRGLQLRKLGGHALRQIDFTGADLSDQNFAGLNLYKAKMSHAVLEGANFTGANIREANMNHAKLSGAVFQNTDARGVKMNFATAHNVAWDGRFEGAEMFELDMEGGTFSDKSRFESARLGRASLATCTVAARGDLFAHADMDTSLEVDSAQRFHEKKATSVGKYALLKKVAAQQEIAMPIPDHPKIEAPLPLRLMRPAHRYATLGLAA
jgi:uncharacterized protein YjbI with pentapeptide repeats